MKIITAVTASLIALTPLAAIAQSDSSATGQSTSRMTSPAGSPGSATNNDATTSGRSSDNTGTQSMAPSSGNHQSGDPEPGMGRGDK